MEMTIEQQSEELIISEFVENQFAVTTSKNTLLGRLYTEKSFSKKIVKSMIKKGWGDPEGLSIIDIGPSTFLFNFSDADTPKNILANAPWNILGQVLLLKQWSPQISSQEVEFSHSPYWIQIHGMPLELLSKDNATRAGSRIGEVLEVEDPFQGTSIIRSFLRVRILLNVKNPLIVGFWIPRQQHTKVWIQVKYEKLMDFCYNCGRLGHDQKGCKHKKSFDAINSNKPMYGPGLSTPPLKKLSKNQENGGSHSTFKEGGDQMNSEGSRTNGEGSQTRDEEN